MCFVLTGCAFKLYNLDSQKPFRQKIKKGENMKKIFKGLFATVLSLGFLAGCTPEGSSSLPPSESEPPVVVKHTVEFYEDDKGKFYLDAEVVHGQKVAKPADPAARKDYDFKGWWTSTAYTTEFNFDTPIVEDINVYGKWVFNPPYVADERVFHLVGDLQNSDLSYINWNPTGVEGTDWDIKSYLEKAKDSNLYSITVELGYRGKFKVKIPNRPWDNDKQFDYFSIREEDMHDYIIEGDSKNIQVTTAGKYLIEVETTYDWARVTRLGDAVGEGVKQDPEVGAIEKWGIVGVVNNWGNIPEGGTEEDRVADTPLAYNEDGAYYSISIVYLPLGEIKLRVDNSWGTEFGSHVDNILEEGAFEQGTELVEEVEVIKAGANIKILKAGYYSVFFDKTKLIIQAVTFALRGTATAGGWDADSAVLALVGEPVAADGKITYKYEGEYDLAVGEFKVKMHEVGKEGNWGVAFGTEKDANGNDNFKVTAAGKYIVTLDVVLDIETLQFTGTASFVAAPGE